VHGGAEWPDFYLTLQEFDGFDKNHNPIWNDVPVIEDYATCSATLESSQ